MLHLVFERALFCCFVGEFFDGVYNGWADLRNLPLNVLLRALEPTAEVFYGDACIGL